MLSVCLITRNEEAVIGRCIQSILPAAAEIILVDTGSTDRTIEIASSLGARILEHKWTGDFSAARNVALDAAGHEWILSIDADEQLSQEDLEALIRISGGRADPGAPSDDHLAYLVTIESWDSAMKKQGNRTRHPALRLFRNLAGVRFAGPIHENIVLPDKAEVGHADISLLHDQTHLSKEETAAKHARNVELLKKRIRHEPKNPELHHYLADEYSELGKLELAAESYQRSLRHRSIDMDKPSPRSAHAMKRLADVLRELGDIEAALAVVREALGIHPEYTDLLYLEGLLCLAQQDLPAAAEAFAACLRQGDAPPRYVSSLGVGGDGARKALHLVEKLARQQQTALRSFLS